MLGTLVFPFICSIALSFSPFPNILDSLPTKFNMPTLTNFYAIQDLSHHKTKDDCWILVGGKVSPFQLLTPFSLQFPMWVFSSCFHTFYFVLNLCICAYPSDNFCSIFFSIACPLGFFVALDLIYFL